jgi:hypothetical protein
MSQDVQHALTGNVLACIVGALVMTVLILKYGIAPTADEPPERQLRRILLTRLAHTAALVCFAVAAILGLLVRAAPPPPPAVPATSEESEARRDVKALDSRIGAIESTVQELSRNLTSVLSRLNELNRSRER